MSGLVVCAPPSPVSWSLGVSRSPAADPKLSFFFASGFAANSLDQPLWAACRQLASAKAVCQAVEPNFCPKLPAVSGSQICRQAASSAFFPHEKGGFFLHLFWKWLYSCLLQCSKRKKLASRKKSLREISSRFSARKFKTDQKLWITKQGCVISCW